MKGSAPGRQMSLAAAKAWLTEYDEWEKQRAKHGAHDGESDGPSPQDWAYSDDQGCDLAHSAEGLIKELVWWVLP